MATTEVKYTLGFEDDTSQDVTIGPFNSRDTALNNVKANVMEFNYFFNSDTANLVLSRYGNKWTGISRTRIITTDIVNYF